MSLNPGDQISYRLMPAVSRYLATVQSADEHNLVLRLTVDSPAVINRGQCLMITEPDADTEHYSEVVSWDGRTLQLKRLWTGKRGYFRVDDVFPVVHRKVDDNDLRRVCKIFSGYGIEPEEMEVSDETMNPKLWKMLTDINAKLAMIIERQNLESEGLSRAESRPVNISASGIRFTLPHRFNIGDILELKMLLPVYPPVGVLAHGTVVRVEELDNGNFGTSLSFDDLAEEVRDTIIQYTLKRQRELIRRERQGDRNE